MNDPIGPRPRVTKVRITVKSDFPAPPIVRTEVEMLTTGDVNEDNFNFWPTLIFSSTNRLEIDNSASRELPSSSSTIAKYIIDNLLLQNPSVPEVDVYFPTINETDRARLDYEYQGP